MENERFVPEWVEYFIDEVHDFDYSDKSELYDYAECLVVDDGITGSDLLHLLEEYVEAHR